MKAARTKKIFLTLVVFVFLLFPSGASAFFNDIETAGTLFQAGTLDIALTDGGWASSGAESALVPGGASVVKTIVSSNAGTLPFQYEVSAHRTGGDEAFCDALEVSALVDGVPQYAGTLTSLVITPLILLPSENDSWQFIVSLPTSATSIPDLLGKTCSVAFVFNGWQENLPKTQGFSDQDELGASVTANVPTSQLRSPRDGAVINGTYVEQVWSPVAGATSYVYQSCHNDPDVAGPCNQRWIEEYSSGSPQFIGTKKWANNVANATYWWRVKVKVGALEGAWSEAWQIVIDNTHQNSVVLNEFLPNPIGDDNALMPNGEWVELYNNTGQDIDLAGWMLYDAYDEHELPITVANTDSGSTLIRSGDFLVVYRNGDGDFSLNQDSSGDTVRLFAGDITTAPLIDSFTYPGPKDEDTSWVRYPDGSDNWADPKPTPGKPNLPEEEITQPIVELEPVFEMPTMTSASEGLTITASELFDDISGIASESEDSFGAIASGDEELLAPEPESEVEIEDTEEEIMTGEPIAESEQGDAIEEEIIEEVLGETQEEVAEESEVIIEEPTEPIIESEPTQIEPPAAPEPVEVVIEQPVISESSSEE